MSCPYAGKADAIVRDQSYARASIILSVPDVPVGRAALGGAGRSFFGNVECGIDRATVEPAGCDRRSNPAFQFRTPHSALRIHFLTVSQKYFGASSVFPRTAKPIARIVIQSA